MISDFVPKPHGEITIKNGRVEQDSFLDYLILGIDEMPVVEVYIVSSLDSHGGVGEPDVPLVAPAAVNEIFATTGRRIRQLLILRVFGLSHA